MATPPELATVALLVACVAAWTDARTRRIPNPISLVGLCAGLALNALRHGPEGLAAAAGGICVGAGLVAPGYLLRLMGAGDVKLMAAVGASLGFPTVVMAALGSYLAGGVLALAMALRARQARHAVRGAIQLGWSLAANVVQPGVALPTGTGLRLPFAVAVVAGTAFALWYGASH